MNERGLNPYCTVARISIDGGQGFLKCIVNNFDPLCKLATSKSLGDSVVVFCTCKKINGFGFS